MACRCSRCRPEVGGVEIKMVLYLPRDAATVPVSRQVLDSCLETLGVTPDTRADIALALSEACANVIRHAGAGEEYQVQVAARNGQCAIEVVNAASADGKPAPDGSRTGRLGGTRGSDEEQGTTVHFEKTLEWLPGAPGQHLFNADDGS
jgi:serine/threonine-protein kinase RsbW